MSNIKRKLENGGIGIRFLICFGISVISILVTALIAALIVARLDDPTAKLGIFSLIAMLISAAISGVITTRVAGDGGTRFALLVALAVVLIMLLINVICYGGKVSGGAFMNYGCYLSVAALCAFIGKKTGRRPRNRY